MQIGALGVLSKPSISFSCEPTFWKFGSNCRTKEGWSPEAQMREYYEYCYSDEIVPLLDRNKE
jgi:hypothetical protein